MQLKFIVRAEFHSPVGIFCYSICCYIVTNALSLQRLLFIILTKISLVSTEVQLSHTNMSMMTIVIARFENFSFLFFGCIKNETVICIKMYRMVVMNQALLLAPMDLFTARMLVMWQ